MRLSYRPTFARFTEDYLATHYSGGVQTFRRLAGGPLMIIVGVIAIVLANARLASLWLRIPSFLLAAALILIGLQHTFMPLFNLFLVWLRRDQLLGGEDASIILELHADHLTITERGQEARLPLKSIKSLQHRTDSTWVLTDTDQLISVPRHDLLTGDHDAFIEALETAIAPDEPEK